MFYTYTNALQNAFNKYLKDALKMFLNIVKAYFIHIQNALQNAVLKHSNLHLEYILKGCFKHIHNALQNAFNKHLK